MLIGSLLRPIGLPSCFTIYPNKPLVIIISYPYNRLSLAFEASLHEVAVKLIDFCNFTLLYFSVIHYNKAKKRIHFDCDSVQSADQPS